MKHQRQRTSPFVTTAIDFAYMLLAAVVVLGGGGYWLDRHWNHSIPWFGILGAGVGIITAFYSLLRRLQLLEQKERARSRERRPGGDQV